MYTGKQFIGPNSFQFKEWAIQSIKYNYESRIFALNNENELLKTNYEKLLILNNENEILK